MQTENRDRGLATVKEAAGHLGLSVAKLYQLMTAGQLPFVKLDKSRRIAWKTLDDLIQRCTVNGANVTPSNN